MLVDQLSSLLDDTSTLEPWTLTGPEIRQVLTAAQQARTGLDALVSRLAGAADSMGLPTEDGATSATAWLANHVGIHKGDAAKLVSLSKATTEHTEATRTAWAKGLITTDKAAVIMKAINALPDWVDDEPRHDAETHLLRLAGEHNLDDLKRLANHVIEVIDPDGADEELGKKLRKEEEKAFNATRFSMTNRGDGTTRGVFNIPNADADTLRAAIEGLINPRRAATNATNLDMNLDDFNALPRDQKMGHAFIELINHLPTDALPQAGGLAATVAVTINIDDLRTGQGFATNTSGTDVSATKAQRMACNARLVGLYLDSDSRVINHGMTKRLFDRHQRLILAGRDGGCVWKGCDRPPAWCEAHHLNFWSENGPTDLDNAALFCHFHHFLLHEGQWTARMALDGIVEVIPPTNVDPNQTPRRHARHTKHRFAKPGPRAG